MARIQLKNVTKSWGNLQAVKPTTLDIQDKEFIVFLGPSGCGKTTTMRMIAGLEAPTTGDIIIDGNVVNDLEPRDRNVAMVFQSYALYAHLSVYENICFPLRVRGVPKKDWHDRAMAAAKMVELENLLDRLPKELSGGQRQRVALARAIVRKEPSCFLMDEPLSNLDAKLRVTMRSEIKHLQQQLQVTVIYVTHDQIEAMTLADRVALIKDGEIQQFAPPTEIYNDPETLFVAGFIGNPAMNLVKGTITDGVFQADGITVKVSDEVKQTDVTLGVRAEDLQIATQATAQITGTVYAFELLGESNMVIMTFGADRIMAKVAKDKMFETGETVYFKAPLKSYYLFDNKTEHRIRTNIPASVSKNIS